MEKAAELQQVDFSFMLLVMQAHWVVQAVFIVLMMSSLLAWAVVFEKFFLYQNVLSSVRKFEAHFWGGNTLEVLYEQFGKKPKTTIERVFSSGINEWHKTIHMGSSAFTANKVVSVRERLERSMNISITREIHTLGERLGLLATVGSVSPFIGLFGTVWGIKDSFQEIAFSQNSSFAIVAPGIAEALLATAVGLIASIPAVIAYNALGKKLDSIALRLDVFSDEFLLLLSRQIDKKMQ